MDTELDFWGIHFPHSFLGIVLSYWKGSVGGCLIELRKAREGCLIAQDSPWVPE